MEEYIVDLGDYSQEIVDKFMLELESKSVVRWGSGDSPTKFKQNREVCPLLHYWDGSIYQRTIPDKTLLTREQFIQKMAELHPKKKQDIRDYCKEHRVWAAKDRARIMAGKWIWYKNRPSLSDDGEIWAMPDDGSYRNRILHPDSFIFPVVEPELSLIAPDGSMPLMEKQEPKLATHFEVGKWYMVMGYEERGPGKLVKIRDYNYLLYHPSWNSGHNSDFYDTELKLSGNHAWYYPSSDDFVEYAMPKQESPKRGDPVFVWDDGCSNRIPARVYYFYDFSENGKVIIFDYSEEGRSSNSWDHYRKFDASLVGIPRKDWDK